MPSPPLGPLPDAAEVAGRLGLASRPLVALAAAGWWLVGPDPAGPPGSVPPAPSAPDPASPAETGARLLLVAPGAVTRELRHATWLAAHGLAPLPVPADTQPARSPGSVGSAVAWFAAPDGWPADAPQNQIGAQTLLGGLGRALRRLHELPPDPELDRLDAAALVDAAAQRVDAGAVDAANLARPRRHLDPAQLVEQLHDLLPLLERRRPVEPVPTHGASRLGTVWLRRGEPVALIGLRDVAVADPYRDLGAMARSLGDIFGPEALPGFFAAYGLPDPDPIRLEFHALLDELR